METKSFILILLVLIFRVCIAQEIGTSQSDGIGFTSLLEIDTSRPSTIDGNLGRIVQINIWYPTEGEQKAPTMDFAGYLRIRHHEMGIKDSNELMRALFVPSRIFLLLSFMYMMLPTQGNIWIK